MGESDLGTSRLLYKTALINFHFLEIVCVCVENPQKNSDNISRSVHSCTYQMTCLIL